MTGSPIYSAFDSPNDPGDVEFLTLYFPRVWKTGESLSARRSDLPGESLRSHFDIPVSEGAKLRIQRLGTTVISRRASIRFSNGGCVLKSAEAPPMPNMGFTMHKDDVVCEIDDVGIR
jgi:hypothetical protein